MKIRGAEISAGAAVAMVLLAGFVLIAVAAPLAAPLDPNRQDLFARLKPPGTPEPRATCEQPRCTTVRPRPRSIG